ncbi:MAG: hypothetical protein QMC36_05855 [Patescibacteria group bacterium]
MKIGRIALALAALTLALASCGAEKSTEKGAPSQDGVTSVSPGKDVPVVVSGKASEF